MIHVTRRYAVCVVATVEELAEKLTGHDWTLCTGFELQGLLFLNDSFSEDGAGEWAVFREGHQVETITFSWCSYERALELIQWLLGGGGENLSGPLPATEPAEQHGKCRFCG